MSSLTEHSAFDPIVRFRLFGPVEILSFNGESVLPRGRKAQAILCHLALCADGSASRQRLVELLWSKREPEQGRGSLRQSLLEIRAAFGAEHGVILSVERDRVTLDRSRIWLDGLSRHADSEPAPPTRPCASITCWRAWPESIQPMMPGPRVFAASSP